MGILDDREEEFLAPDESKILATVRTSLLVGMLRPLLLATTAGYEPDASQKCPSELRAQAFKKVSKRCNKDKARFSPWASSQVARDWPFVKSRVDWQPSTPMRI